MILKKTLLKIAGGLISASLLAGSLYYAYTEWRSLTEQNALLNKEILEIKENLDIFKDQVEKDMVAREELDNIMSESRKRQRELISQFESRNVNILLQNKAALTVAAFQNGTNQFYRRVEEETKK